MQDQHAQGYAKPFFIAERQHPKTWFVTLNYSSITGKLLIRLCLTLDLKVSELGEPIMLIACQADLTVAICLGEYPSASESAVSIRHTSVVGTQCPYRPEGRQ